MNSFDADYKTEYSKHVMPGGPRLRIGSRLLANAYDSRGTVLLAVGSHVDSLSQLFRLMQSDVRYGERRSVEIPFDMENEAALDAAEAATSTGATDPAERICHAVALKAEAVKEIASVFGRIESTGVVDVTTAEQSVSTLVRELMDDRVALTSMVRLKNTDEYTFTHSVNVSILAMYLSLYTRYAAQVEIIGIGALLHDVGKVKTPLSVLHKRGPLDDSELEIIRMHPKYGAELLFSSGCRDEVVLTCVLDHHEKINGGGYPFGKLGDKIAPYARIISLADIYDALTTDRPYRKALTPKEALRMMVEKMSPDLDSHMLSRFVSVIGCFADYPTVQSGSTAIPKTEIVVKTKSQIQDCRHLHDCRQYVETRYSGIDFRC